MYSLQRRNERYRILYMWKIMNGLAPNCGVSWGPTEVRLGRMCQVPKLAQKARKLREQSFQYQGPKLFNCLPVSLRNKVNCSLEEFKADLDQFLQNIPDEPSMSALIPGATNPQTARPSNSLPDQVALWRRNQVGAHTYLPGTQRSQVSMTGH